MMTANPVGRIWTIGDGEPGEEVLARTARVEITKLSIIHFINCATPISVLLLLFFFFIHTFLRPRLV
jgi:hypothetical protein